MYKTNKHNVLIRSDVSFIHNQNRSKKHNVVLMVSQRKAGSNHQFNLA